MFRSVGTESVWPDFASVLVQARGWLLSKN